MTDRIERCRDALRQVAKLSSSAAEEPLTEELALRRLKTIEMLAREAQAPQTLFEQLSDETKRLGL